MKEIHIYDTVKRTMDDAHFDDILKLEIFFSRLYDRGYNATMLNRESNPDEFNANPEVVKLYEEKGAEAFPCLTVDGKIVYNGRFPSQDLVIKLSGIDYDPYEFDVDNTEMDVDECDGCSGDCNSCF